MKKSPLFIIFLVVFIDLVGFGIVIPILPYYAKTYGASAVALGWLMTSYSALQFLFSPIWGALSDRVGRRPVLLVSMFGTMLSMILLGWAPSLTWLFIGRAFAGLCGANISTASAYIADVTTPENRAKGMGMIGAAFGLGFIFGPAIGGVLSKFGYDTPMYFAAALSCLNILFAFIRLPEPPLSQETRSRNRAKRFDPIAIRRVAGDSRTRVATIAFFVVTLAVTQMEVVFALFMQARYGYDAQGAGWLLALMGVIMVLIQGGLIGRLSKFFGERGLALAGTALMAIALLLLAQSNHIIPVIMALTLLAIGHGLTNPSLSALASLGSDAATRGATMGVYQSAGSLARVLGPPLAGLFYERLRINAPFLAAAMFLFSAALGLALWKGHKNRQSPFGRWIGEIRSVFRTRGVRGIIKTYGWKVVACFFAYYLIRDLTLYVLLPFLAAKGVLSL